MKGHGGFLLCVMFLPDFRIAVKLIPVVGLFSGLPTAGVDSEKLVNTFLGFKIIPSWNTCQE